MALRWPPLLALLAWRLAQRGAVATGSTFAGTGLCPDGQAINTAYCDGDCHSRCICFSDINTCCCPVAPGHFSRGYAKVPCPGGTYQDQAGGLQCKACNTSEALYNLNERGAVDLLDCLAAPCSGVCTPGDATCEAQQCMTAPSIVAAMVADEQSMELCRKLAAPIPDEQCSWVVPSASSRAFLAGNLALVLAWWVLAR